MTAAVRKQASAVKVVAISVSAFVVVVGGALFATYGFLSYAAETDERCIEALQNTAELEGQIEASLASGETIIETVVTEGIQFGAGSMLHYPDRMEVDETYLAERTETHASDLHLVESVEASIADVSKISLSGECLDRSDVKRLDAAISDASPLLEKLEQGTEALSADHTLFIEEQNERYEADKVATQKRVAAEQSAGGSAEECMFEDCQPHHGGGAFMPWVNE